MYALTFLISSKRLSQFEDYPMPDCYPDFCSHEQVLAYLESYARAFAAILFIRFRTRVCHCRVSRMDAGVSAPSVPSAG